MMTPVVALPGEYVLVWLNRTEETLTVVDAQRKHTVRSASVPHGIVSGALLHHCIDGTLVGLTRADEMALRWAA